MIRGIGWAVAYGLTYFDSKEKTPMLEIFDKIKKYFQKIFNIVSP
jgi:hypothetical protein